MLCIVYLSVYPSPTATFLTELSQEDPQLPVRHALVSVTARTSRPVERLQILLLFCRASQIGSFYSP